MTEQQAILYAKAPALINLTHYLQDLERLKVMLFQKGSHSPYLQFQDVVCIDLESSDSKLSSLRERYNLLLLEEEPLEILEQLKPMSTHPDFGNHNCDTHHSKQSYTQHKLTQEDDDDEERFIVFEECTEDQTTQITPQVYSEHVNVKEKNLF